jgi:VanZ family protein
VVASVFRSGAYLTAFLAMAFAFGVAVGHPFQWWRMNGARLDVGTGTFLQAGILLVDEPAQWLREAKVSGEFLVRLVVRPFLANQDGPARILTISDSTSWRNFTIGQQRADLVIRLRRNPETLNGTPDYLLPGVFADTMEREVVAAIRDNELTVYVDGELRVDQVLPDRAMSFWNENFDIALGNEISLNRPWLGEITVAHIETAERASNLLAPSVLRKPPLLVTINKPAVVSNARNDLLLNFIALLPLGFLSAGCLRRPRAVTVGLIWLPVCLLFESMQIVTPGRFPSLSDVVMNVSGALAGAALFSAALHASPVAKLHSRLNGEP